MDLYNISFDMEDWYDISIENDTYGLEPDLPPTFFVTSCIVSSIGLPLTLLAIYALYSLVQENNVAPVYVINLLISDLIQMCCFVILVAQPKNFIMFVVSAIIYSIGLMASVGFMVCVAMERFLVIACPLWYCFRRNIKITLVVCLMIWVLPLLLGFLGYFSFKFLHEDLLLPTYLLLPFPLLIFFLAGTVKALSSSISEGLSPLMDLVLYIFMKKGTVDKLLGCLCRCRMTTEQEQGQMFTADSNTPQMVSSM
ncbi:mas-related G-protein coupled receptor member B1-like [Myripristis murdjan]|uniref:mas-related G-protein coupled receptor member B1-like n=1 Tax=Myripristis murdjan TaxID=586833 RepID=UPI001175EE95|nr:mas-related G-protein coupled receptor member B1-like [Myripristis murdjan]